MDAAPEASTSAAAGAIDDVALPLFKKRSNRPGAASKRRLASEDRFADVGADGGASTPEAEGTDDEPAGATMEELLALRKLRKAKGGIDLHRLNEGEKKKRKRKKVDEGADTGAAGYGMQSSREERIEDDDPEDEEAKTRKLVTSNNFTGQTNALDVDKYMMAYIESELKARRDKALSEGKDAPAALQGAEALASLDPRDELYRIAEKYRVDKNPVIEGNVTLSAAMLTAIPEVDLGIDTRLKNIEATEKAKRKLAEEAELAAAAAHQESVKEHFATDRFLLPNQQWSTDAEALEIAKLESEGMTQEAEALRRAVKKQAQSQRAAQARAPAVPGVATQQLATDDKAVQRFKQRMQNQRR